MIKIQNLSKTYKNFRLSIHKLLISNGDVVGIVGHNGSGKSTFLRAILDLTQLNEGEIIIDSIPHRSMGWKAFTGAYLDESFLIDYLTVYEYINLVLGFYDKRLKKQDLEKLLEDFDNIFDLNSTNILNKKIRTLSKGNKEKVGILSALIVNPKLVILDEPFANLDDEVKQNIRNELILLNRRTGCTILLSSNDLGVLIPLCTRIIVFEKGKIKSNLTMNELDDKALNLFGNIESRIELYLNNQINKDNRM